MGQANGSVFGRMDGGQWTLGPPSAELWSAGCGGGGGGGRGGMGGGGAHRLSYGAGGTSEGTDCLSEFNGFGRGGGSEVTVAKVGAGVAAHLPPVKASFLWLSPGKRYCGTSFVALWGSYHEVSFACLTPARCTTSVHCQLVDPTGLLLDSTGLPLPRNGCFRPEIGACVQPFFSTRARGAARRARMFLFPQPSTKTPRLPLPRSTDVILQPPLVTGQPPAAYPPTAVKKSLPPPKMTAKMTRLRHDSLAIACGGAKHRWATEQTPAKRSHTHTHTHTHTHRGHDRQVGEHVAVHRGRTRGAAHEKAVVEPLSTRARRRFGGTGREARFGVEGAGPHMPCPCPDAPPALWGIPPPRLQCPTGKWGGMGGGNGGGMGGNGGGMRGEMGGEWGGNGGGMGGEWGGMGGNRGEMGGE